MAAKDFGMSNLKKNPRKTVDIQQEKEPETQKIKRGRPKTKPECKTVNIAIPIELLEGDIQIAKKRYNDNLTEYINALIKKDLEANLESYKKFVEFLNT